MVPVPHLPVPPEDPAGIDSIHGPAPPRQQKPATPSPPPLRPAPTLPLRGVRTRIPESPGRETDRLLSAARYRFSPQRIPRADGPVLLRGSRLTDERTFARWIASRTAYLHLLRRDRRTIRNDGINEHRLSTWPLHTSLL